MDKNVEQKKNEMLQAAKNWWLGKPDPKDAQYGTYVCDVCNGPIREKEGTSLLGSYMRCKNCTERLFSLMDKGEV